MGSHPEPTVCSQLPGCHFPILLHPCPSGASVVKTPVSFGQRSCLPIAPSSTDKDEPPHLGSAPSARRGLDSADAGTGFIRTEPWSTRSFSRAEQSALHARSVRVLSSIRWASPTPRRDPSDLAETVSTLSSGTANVTDHDSESRVKAKISANHPTNRSLPHDADRRSANRLCQAKETATYHCAEENQLASVATDTNSTPTGSRWKSDFVYDGKMRLRKRTDFVWGPGYWSSSGEVRYVYDGMLPIQERNSGNTPTVTYTRGSDLSGTPQGAGGIGGLLGRSHGYSSGTGGWSTHNFYHADGIGNVTAMLGAAQASVASYKYDPFGNLLSSSGTLASANVYRFSSKEVHPNSGFYGYGYRFYDPAVQRWLSRDPLGEPGFELLRGRKPDLLGDGPNLYLFVGNNPINVIDLLGLRRKFAADEQKKIDAMLKAIKDCAQKVGDKDVLKAINALDLKGIFDANDIKKDPSRKNDSETTFGFYWTESDTVLAGDFFQDNNTWNDKVRAEVLIHEGWHAWKKAVQEDKAYKFGSDKCDSLWNCIKQKLGIK